MQLARPHEQHLRQHQLPEYSSLYLPPPAIFASSIGPLFKTFTISHFQLDTRVWVVQAILSV